jgi:hypothetical protein
VGSDCEMSMGYGLVHLWSGPHKAERLGISGVLKSHIFTFFTRPSIVLRGENETYNFGYECISWIGKCH